MRCIRCHRPLTREPQDGMGPRCYAKAGMQAAVHERDLFGFTPALACEAATARLRVFVSVLAAQARIDVLEAVAAARGRLGVRS